MLTSNFTCSAPADAARKSGIENVSPASRPKSDPVLFVHLCVRSAHPSLRTGLWEICKPGEHFFEKFGLIRMRDCAARWIQNTRIVDSIREWRELWICRIAAIWKN